MDSGKSERLSTCRHIGLFFLIVDCLRQSSCFLQPFLFCFSQTNKYNVCLNLHPVFERFSFTSRFSVNNLPLAQESSWSQRLGRLNHTYIPSLIIIVKFLMLSLVSISDCFTNHYVIDNRINELVNDDSYFISLQRVQTLDIGAS